MNFKSQRKRGIDRAKAQMGVNCWDPETECLQKGEERGKPSGIITLHSAVAAYALRRRRKTKD